MDQPAQPIDVALVVAAIKKADFTRKQIRSAAVKQGYSETAIDAALTKADGVIASERDKDNLSSLDDDLAAFVANAPVMITPSRHSAVINALKAKLPEGNLVKVNQALKDTKAGPLTYDDLAYLGCIHWVSVTTNGENNPHFRNTSPTDRLTLAPAKFGYRKKPFDYRQVRMFLIVFSNLKVSREEYPAIRGGENARAAVYSMTNDQFWVDAFTTK